MEGYSIYTTGPAAEKAQSPDLSTGGVGSKILEIYFLSAGKFVH